MTPTPKLRWIEREHEVGLTGNMVHVETVLQQWWSYDPDSYTDWVTKTNGEWRDIPLEKEE